MTADEPVRSNKGITLPDPDWYDDAIAVVAIRPDGSSVLGAPGVAPVEVVNGLIHVATSMATGAGAYISERDTEDIEKFANGEGAGQ